MAWFLGKRLLQAALILLGAALITFLLLYWLPADPAVLIAGRNSTPQTIDAIRRELGLDQPLVVQFWHYLQNLLQGDLGRSYSQKTAVAPLIMARLPATLTLMAAGIAVETGIGLVLGVIAAVRRDSLIDRVVMMVSFAGVSSPQFVAGLLMLFVFAAKLGWFPMAGFNGFSSIVLPALTLGILGAGWYARMVRSAMIEVLRQDYIRTARAKGVSNARVIFRHALPNALLPIIAMIGIDIGQFMGGIVVVESVFGWPGIGQLAWQAIQQLDVPIIMGVTLVSSVAIITGNLIADFIAPFIDPRIRTQ